MSFFLLLFVVSNSILIKGIQGFHPPTIIQRTKSRFISTSYHWSAAEDDDNNKLILEKLDDVIDEQLLETSSSSTEISFVDDMGRIQYSTTPPSEEKEEETTTPITATDNDVLDKEEEDVVDEQLLESTSTETPPEAAEQNDDEGEEEEQMPERPTFNSIGLSPEILSAVRAQPDWFFPTPVQALGIPQILSGPDFIWCESPTGSGKTAAFALPLLQQLYYRKKEENKNTKKKNKKKGGSIASLILCPTRELAMQVSNVLSNLSHNTGGNRDWDIMTLHGGVPIDPQIAALGNAIRDSRTIDVVVATPGRLVDVLTYYDNDSEKAAKAALNRRLLDALDSRGKTDASLSLGQIEKLSLDRIDDDGRGSLPVLFAGLRHLVIDEADRLLGKAFEKEVNSCLDLLLATDKGYDNIDKIKTWIFSATFPKSIEPRVNNVFQRLGSSTPLRIFLSNSNRIVDTDVSSSLQKRLDKTRGATTLQEICSASTINHRAIQLEKSQRTLVLRKLLDENPEWDRVLVFVSTRYASEHVSLKLRRNGILSAELHGKLDQEARDRRLRAFSKGKIRVLLATDVASRGLDVVGLPAVVNYDLPRSTADFVHRTGRTGRAGKQGTAITLVTAPGESHLKLIEKRHLSQPIPREKLSGFEPDEIEYQIQYSASEISPPGTQHSSRGLAYDKMNGGIKGNRKSKKDRLREKAAVVEMNNKQEQL
eukprot:CAMPEP_0194171980 /NCGR_PEP_ID=MMETSP0154-20130528/6531_1 /TAXON_ID=1049557 /ORGANISM="Thalassiothrix antarctica, Strain L6-D1" /LENGTH=708 /DNA_ID=CAMNT_0038884513 /DNA_START=39 /DNA_END=2165 /DNA_ORIENTATION=-